MGGSKKSHPKFKEDSVIIAKKIVCYAGLDPTGEKFLKYMRHVNQLRQSVPSSHNRSIWTNLKNHGALSRIMETLQTLFASEDVQRLTVVDTSGKRSNATNEEGKRSARIADICNVGLSILSNAFALDYAVRSETMKNGFISSLQKFIANFTSDIYISIKHAEVISRAVKCAANLSNDAHCRELVLKNGVAISILRLLDNVNEKISESPPDPEKDSFIDSSQTSQLLCSCVRAVRIMSSDSKYLTSDHFQKFGGLVTLMNTLSWEGKLTANEDFILDVVRALTFLSVRIRSAPFDVVQTIIYNPESCKLRCLVRLLENTQAESKLSSSLINCLINFSSNKEVSDCLGALRIFHIILTKLSDIDEEQNFHDLIKLLIALTRYSSFNQSHLATSPLIGSTLKILKSSHYKDYHEWILKVYEKLYEVSLSKLVQSGLVTHLCDLFRGEIEHCDYDSLRKKISSLDDSKCSVHITSVCPFAPTYRCSSPSYLQIREEMRSKISTEAPITSLSLKRGEDSLSPLSSPAHSWSSSGSNSPMHSDISSASFSSFSEDEGCFSPSNPSKSDTPSSALSEDEAANGDETLTEVEESEGPPSKKRKLASSYSPPLSSGFNSDLASKLQDCEIQPTKSLEALKVSAKKIASILNILYKCTHIKPFPESILQIVPILLGILLRGKVSLMPQGIEYQSVPKDTELTDLSRRTFEVAYKILLQMCSVIQIFPEMIISGMIPVLHRLQEPFTSTTSNNVEQGAVVQKYCDNIISRMVGFENDTAGWREGFIMRSALVNSSGISKENMDQMLVNIPLFYQKHVTTLRKFERKARSFTLILDMLKKSDNASFYRFEDCALALCSICRALGVKWTAPDPDVPLLINTASDSTDDGNTVIIVSSPESLPEQKVDDVERVRLILDDGTVFWVKKELLCDASPVFSAMFNGHFIEADQQQVNLSNVSKESVTLLIDQIHVLGKVSNEESGRNCESFQYDMSAIFQLITLADRFLLEEIYERALNTLIIKYLCPYSAPLFYAESVKLSNLQKSGCNQKLGDSDFSLLILKYILTAENIRMSERCNAIRKVFDSVVPDHVVQDLQKLINDNMYKNN